MTFRLWWCFLLTLSNTRILCVTLVKCKSLLLVPPSACWVCECLQQTPLCMFCLAFDWKQSYFCKQQMHYARGEIIAREMWGGKFCPPPLLLLTFFKVLWRRVFLLSYDNVAFQRQITCHRHSACPAGAQSNNSSFQIDWDLNNKWFFSAPRTTHVSKVHSFIWNNF